MKTQFDSEEGKEWNLEAGPQLECPPLKCALQECALQEPNNLTAAFRNLKEIKDFVERHEALDPKTYMFIHARILNIYSEMEHCNQYLKEVSARQNTKAYDMNKNKSDKVPKDFELFDPLNSKYFQPIARAYCFPTVSNRAVDVNLCVVIAYQLEKELGK